MEAFSRCISTCTPRLMGAAASSALGSASRQQRFMNTSTWPQTAAPTQKVNRRTELDYEELNNLLMMEDVALIDVRPPKELQAYGEIPGSINIPLNDLKSALQLPDEQFMQQFSLDKPTKGDRNLVFYARGPNVSRTAVEIAHRLGFKGSRHYSGGWEDYCNRTGVPLKKTSDITFNSEMNLPSLPMVLVPNNEPQGNDTASPYYYGHYDFYM